MAKRKDQEYYKDYPEYDEPQDELEYRPRMTKKTRKTPAAKERGTGFVSRHPIFSNLVIIIIVATLGLFIAYLSLGLFTNHGEADQVPQVMNMRYSDAVEKLHDAGFKAEIRDSVYSDDVRPGLVVDQFPSAGSVVKPGRKIYLYINALHPKEVIIDPGTATNKPALYGDSERQALAKLQELGFKKIKVEHVPGVDDYTFEVLANGKRVKKLQSVPLNAAIILRVHQTSRPTADNSSYRVDFSSSSDSNAVSDGYGTEIISDEVIVEEEGGQHTEVTSNSNLE
ncbi:MAG: PASTA domain-containing protein [Muribaculaceae bacterium]|nr:PASTA domain-containing protein [Muribaculaceae bacterium]